MKQLLKIKVNKAPGPDCIYPRILKELRDKLVKPLTIIFSKSINDGIVPQDWKRANVTPMFKIGKKCDSSNYRPVSLTSVPCKMLESIIKEDIMTYLTDNEIISHSQYGFMPGRSCQSNLLEYLDFDSKEVDNKNPVDTIYFYFSKAFDKVPHKRLLRKLEAIGICENVYNWIPMLVGKQKTEGSSQWSNIKVG